MIQPKKQINRQNRYNIKPRWKQIYPLKPIGLTVTHKEEEIEGFVDLKTSCNMRFRDDWRTCCSTEISLYLT